MFVSPLDFGEDFVILNRTLDTQFLRLLLWLFYTPEKEKTDMDLSLNKSLNVVLFRAEKLSNVCH